MIVRPGDLVGFPPELVLDLSWSAFFRYVLVGLVAWWSVVVASGRRGMVLGGILIVETVLAFWILSLGRPYGVLADPATTRWAEQVSVALTTHEPATAAGAHWSLPILCRLGVSPDIALLMPTFAPLLVMPVLGLLVLGLWEQRGQAALGATLWVAFSTGDLDAIRGLGFLPGLWARPAASLLLALIVMLVLALGRLRLSRPLQVTSSLAVMGLWLFVRGSGGGLGLADAVLALTFDQGLWLLLGILGLRGSDDSARLLTGGGALVVLAGALSPAVDPWGGHALFRLGLLLAAAGPFERIAVALGSFLADRLPRRLRLQPRSTGLAALLLILVPGSFPVWWDARRLDPVMRDSLVLLPAPLLDVTAWIRQETPAGAVFVASPAHAPQIAVLAGRNVRGTPVPGASGRRQRREDERGILEHLARDRITHVFAAPGDFGFDWTLDAGALAAHSSLRLRYATEDYRVYEVVP